MSLIYANRVHEAASGSGNQNLTLLGALSGKATFTSKIQTGTLVPYVLLDGNGVDWEVGFGTLASATELQRTTVVDSSASSGRINSEEAGSPVKISLSTNQHEVFIAPNALNIFSMDEDGEIANPSAIRAALFVDDIADMTALSGLVDGETVFVRGDASLGDGLGACYRWDAADAGAESNPESYEHDVEATGLFKKVRYDIQGLVRSGSFEIDAVAADATGGELKVFHRKKATAATAWSRWTAHYASGEAQFKLGIRHLQASAEKFFVAAVSVGDNFDRVELLEPTVLPSRANAQGFKARSLAWLSGSSRLGYAKNDGVNATTAPTQMYDIPLTVGGFVAATVETITALKAIDAAAMIVDGDKALVLGTSALGDAPSFYVKWSSASSASADDVSVFRPSVGAAASGNGRWLRVRDTTNGSALLVTQTGGATARTLAAWLGDLANVLGHGAVGDGVTNDATPFTNAEARDRLTFIPQTGNAYVLSTAVATTTGAWLQDPTVGLIANLDMRRGLYRDRYDGSNVWRFADKVYIDAATLNGGNYHSDGSWLTSVVGAGYIERASSLVAINSFGGPGATFATRASERYYGNTIWEVGQSITAGQKRGYSNRLYEATSSGTTAAPGPTHSSGTVADGGGVNWLHIEAEGVVTAAYMSFMLNDAPPDGFDRYGAYMEVVRETMAGTTIAKEIDVKNKAGNVLVNPFRPFGNGGGATIGYMFAGGGDSTYGGAAANPSSVAISINKNTHTWNTGILFEADALTGNDGTTGSSEAISMAKGMELNWYRSNSGVGTRTTRIKSSIDTANEGIGLEFSTNIMWLISLDDNSKVFFQARRVASSVNFVETLASATGNAVSVNAAGDDTNIDISITPKGTGVVRTVSSEWLLRTTSPTAGGVLAVRIGSNATAFGVYAGSGAPSIAAGKGSIYLRTDGTGTNDRAYINTDGSTTWTALVTVA